MTTAHDKPVPEPDETEELGGADAHDDAVYVAPLSGKQRERLNRWRENYSNRPSRLFVVPPYVEDEDFTVSLNGTEGEEAPALPTVGPGNRYSFRPMIIENPAQALKDRLTLPGSFLFDSEAERRRND